MFLALRPVDAPFDAADDWGAALRPEARSARMNASRLVTPRHCGMRLREAKQREGLALRDDCLSSGHPVRPTQGTVMMNRRTLLSSAAGMAAAAALLKAASAAPGERAVVIFFSRRGENYAPGGVEHLDVGHTERVARRIAERTGADLFTRSGGAAFRPSSRRSLTPSTSRARPSRTSARTRVAASAARTGRCARASRRRSSSRASLWSGTRRPRAKRA